MQKISRLIQALVLSLICHQVILANITLSPLFSDHMVLQRDAPVHIWGSCSPNSTITVNFAGQKIHTRSTHTTWEAVLQPIAAGGPYTLVIESTNKIVVKDILMGDVWICAGQSNMRFRVNQSFDGDMAAMQEQNPNLRFSDWEGSLNPINKRYPLDFLRQLTPANFYTSREWEKADSASTANFSAVGYFFGRNLQAATQVPIGLINNSIGGVPLETYLPLSGITNDSILYPLSAPGWLQNPLYPAWTAERVMQNLVAWKEESPLSPMPMHPYQPGFLFDAAIAPLQKLAVKGVIWYQGESNATFTADSSAMDPQLNKHKLSLLIHSWRKHFNNPSLPFVIIQLPAIKRDWELYREVQLATARDIPAVSLVVTLDLGHPTDVHPRNKKTVGERAARAALANVYNRKLVAGGPLYESFRTEGKHIIITCSNASSGLSTSDGAALRSIWICGTDKKFYPARASFKKNEIWLSAEQVIHPVAARYAWEDNPVDANLINQEGLPASPFRTDL